MRQVKEYATVNGPRFRVRYRSGGVDTSETFVHRSDAHTFAAIMGDGRSTAQIADALAWLAARQREPDVATFADYFRSYLEQLTGITPRTRADYEAQHRRYLTSLDHLPISLITRAHVAAIVNDLDDRGLSPKTIKNAVNMLSSVMGMAVDDGMIGRNPVKRVRLPKARLDEHTTRFMTPGEFVALLGAIPYHYQPLVVFLVSSGMRWSEATALQARHVDLDAGTVRVERAWKRVPGGWEIGPPKSTKSRRTTNPSAPGLIAAATLLRKPNDLVFVTERGGVIRHANFYNRVWRPACDAAGLDPRPTPHDLRHTYASWAISNGTTLAAIQRQLGHESADTTDRVYAHLLPTVGIATGKATSAVMYEVLGNRPEFSRFALMPGGGEAADHR